MSNKDILSGIAQALQELTDSKPNGELKRIEACVNRLDTAVTEIHDKIMDPVDGLIVSVNKNTEFRKTCEPERDQLLEQFKGVLRWKKIIEWGLAVLFVAFIGAIIQLFVNT